MSLKPVSITKRVENILAVVDCDALSRSVLRNVLFVKLTDMKDECDARIAEVQNELNVLKKELRK
jgi:hypothetical protein